MQIVFACGPHGLPWQWDFTDRNRPCGGSEFQLLGMAEELAILGHDVCIYNDCPLDGLTKRYDSGGLLTMQRWNKPYVQSDVFIGWRHYALLAERHAPVQILSAHDVAHEPHWPMPTGYLNNVDYVWTLNEYHKKLYLDAGARIWLPEDRVFVNRIGIDVSNFDQEVERIPGRCIYLSHPNRGLWNLLEMWPAIRERVPHATLQPCWWEPELLRGRDMPEGILPVKVCNPKELAKEILQANLFTYPSTFGAEISPAACVLAQCGGAWPVIVNSSGGMDQVCHYASRSNFEDYEDDVVAALVSCDNGHADQLRKIMIPDMRWNYDFKRVAYEFEGILKGLVAGNGL